MTSLISRGLHGGGSCRRALRRDRGLRAGRRLAARRCSIACSAAIIRPRRRRPRARTQRRRRHRTGAAHRAARGADPPDDRHDRAVAVPQPAARSADPRHGTAPSAPQAGQLPAAAAAAADAPGIAGRGRADRPAAAAAPGRRSDVFDPAQHPECAGAPHALGSVPSRSRRRRRGRSRRSARRAAAAPGAPLDLSTLATGIRRRRCPRRTASRPLRRIGWSAARRPVPLPPPPLAQPERHRRGGSRSRRPRTRRRTTTTSPTAMCCARTTRWRKTPSRAS